MANQDKHYTADDIKLVGKERGGKVYLFLSFHYGYGTPTLGANGKVKMNYQPLVVAIGHNVPQKHWEAPRKENGVKTDGDFTISFKTGRATKGEWGAIMAAVATQRDAMIKAYRVFRDKGIRPRPDQIVSSIRTKAVVVQQVRLGAFIRTYADTVHGNSEPTRQKYITLARLVDRLEQVHGYTIDLQDFSQQHWEQLTNMVKMAACCLTLTTKLKDLVWVSEANPIPHYNQSTLEKFQQNLKSVLHYARDHKQMPLQMITSTLKKVQRVETEKACLSIEQLDTLIKGTVSNKAHDDARKVFVVMCLCGVAISDIREFMKAPIDINRGRRMVFKSTTYVRSKTGVIATVPLTAPVLDILEAPELPAIPEWDQQFNDDLKAACKALGFDDTVNVIDTKADGSTDHQRVPFHEAVSSHMGRAMCKYVWEEVLSVGRPEVCQLMAHALPDIKGADQAYRRMPRAQRAEKALLAARGAVEFEQIPFQFMPPMIALTKAA